MPDNIYLGLVHYPVYDKGGDIVATAITNLDIHDIARMARTYGIRRYFMITPLETQQEMAGRVLRHWTEGTGADYNPLRKEALSRVSVVPDLETAQQAIAADCDGRTATVIATTARLADDAVDYSDLRRRMAEDAGPFLVLFGTGWGMEERFLKKAHYRLKPISGPESYNHLSVRSAAAIIVDRLLGDRQE
ncbi:MAG: RNA methyltransferase [Nitrospirota bacterium]|nr:RNA methyltransferase [Nitrospirota bacterium]